MSLSNDYHHGYASGRDGTPRDSFESLVSSQEHEAFLAKQIARREVLIDQLDAQFQHTTVRQEALQQEQQALASAHTAATVQVAQLTNQLSGHQGKIAALATQRLAVTPDYSVVGGLFFLVAGLSFLLGDLVISHEIVAYALNIRDTTEAWAFAAGLAMVTVLLKPVYDRLLERPYQADPVRHRNRYARFKLALAGFALLTLTVLGWFRYEAYRTDQLKAAINRTIRQLQQNALPANETTTPVDPAILANIEQQLQQSGALTVALVSSPWAMLSFVLSGVLFALAGAVCLGIGLPVLASFWTRWLQIDPRSKKLRRQEQVLLDQLTPLKMALQAQETASNHLTDQLSRLPGPDQLARQRHELMVELDTLGNEHRLATTDRRIAQYTDGYAKGEVDRNAPPPRYSQAIDPVSALTPRPHEAIRQLLRQRLNQARDD